MPRAQQGDGIFVHGRDDWVQVAFHQLERAVVKEYPQHGQACFSIGQDKAAVLVVNGPFAEDLATPGVFLGLLKHAFS